MFFKEKHPLFECNLSLGDKMQDELISEHIFLFPFSWKFNHKKKNHLFSQHTQIQSNFFEHLDNWEPCRLQLLSEKDYNEFVYFYKPIRMALYTLDKQPIIVRNYKYKDLSEDNYFIIVVNQITYKLKIRSIGIKLYKTGIGVLAFDLLNTAYDTVEAIESINSFSKSVYPPILPLSKAKEELFPDYIILHLNEKCHIKEYYRDMYD